MAYNSPLPLPKAYQWLNDIKGPRILIEALKIHGCAETPGPRHNPMIMGWLEELGFDWIKSDETPWCGTTIAICVKRAGKKVHPEMPRARYWLDWGTHVPKGLEKLGDVLIFSGGGRGAAAGHVGLYVGEDDTHFHVLGGNQGNRMCIARILKKTLVGARRTTWTTMQPADVAKRYVRANGAATITSQA